MKQRRLVLRVILKLMSLSALLVLLLVFVYSFTPFFKNSPKKIPLATIDISNMEINEIRKTRWQGKEVAVLYRGLHDTTEKNKSYFVFMNIGDSGACPLKFSHDRLTDICTSTQFDLSGKEQGNKQALKQLSIPPHHFVGNKLIIGR